MNHQIRKLFICFFHIIGYETCIVLKGAKNEVAMITGKMQELNVKIVL